MNQCWYAARTIQVRREYGLTTDQAEPDAAGRVLSGCESASLVVPAPGASTTPTPHMVLSSRESKGSNRP